MRFPYANADLFRRRGRHEEGRVTFVELFFDLVFVFAITQLSHALLEDLTVTGAAHVSLLLLAVWWVWVYTAWITNWLDPQRSFVRLLLFALMLAGLVLSASIPTAFAETGLVFAGAYAFMQVGRTLFMIWASGVHSARNLRNFQRVIVWLLASAVLWVAGGLAGENLRVILWLAALAIEYISPAAGFFVPGLGRSTTEDWDIEGGHLAERCGLFIIIALGESILVTGATLAGLAWDAPTVTAFIVAFVGSVAMWWIYFNVGAERGSREIAHSANPGRLGRLVYTYMHIVIVAGIIVCAAADEVVLMHPLGHAEASAVAVILGGPAIYLVGNILFKRAIVGRMPLSHLVGLALLALLLPFAAVATPLALGAATSATLVIVATWETISLRSYLNRRNVDPINPAA
jgi:low temperature requirement protein LtrA